MSSNSAEWKKRLKRIKDYKVAKEASENLGSKLPDGRYKGKVTSAELAESQSSGREQINIFIKVIEGEYTDQIVGYFPGLDEKSLQFTLAAIRNLGQEVPEDPEDIVEVVDQINTDLPEVIFVVKDGWTSILAFADSTKEDQIGDEVSEEEIEEEIEGEVEEGSTVSFDWNGKEFVGEVVEIREKENKLVIKSNGKKYSVKAEKVSLVVKEEPEEKVEEEVEEEEEKPTKKVIRKK